MSARSVALAVALVAWAGAPSSLRAAEELVLKNGTVVRGDLVGFDQAQRLYLVQIGAFVKAVAEGDVRTIRTVGGPTPAGPARPPTGPSTAPVGTPAVVMPPPATAAPATGRAPSPHDMAAKMAALQAQSPALQRLARQQAAALMSGAPLDPTTVPAESLQDLQSLQGNPQIHEIMEQLSDPACQESLLQGLGAMGGGEGGEGVQGQDQLQLLRSLFQQLNALQGRQEPPPGR